MSRAVLAAALAILSAPVAWSWSDHIRGALEFPPGAVREVLNSQECQRNDISDDCVAAIYLVINAECPQSNRRKCYVRGLNGVWYQKTWLRRLGHQYSFGQTVMRNYTKFDPTITPGSE